MDIHIGCSGWYYEHWRGTFYPTDLKKAGWLPFYAQHFSSVEINATFYHVPTVQSVERWHESTPEGFRFVVKGSQTITHRKQMVDTEDDLDFFYTRIAPLGYKLKAVLWQYPPQYVRTSETMAALERFCRHLVRLERKCVFEFRDESWLHDDVAALLQSCGFEFVVADHPRFYLERTIPQLGDMLYIRMHGNNGDHAALYSEEQMRDLADLVTSQAADPGIRDCLIMFNNDITSSAIHNARTLQQLLHERMPGHQPGWEPGALVQPMLPGFQG